MTNTLKFIRLNKAHLLPDERTFKSIKQKLQKESDIDFYTEKKSIALINEIHKRRVEAPLPQPKKKGVFITDEKIIAAAIKLSEMIPDIVHKQWRKNPKKRK